MRYTFTIPPKATPAPAPAPAPAFDDGIVWQGDTEEHSHPISQELRARLVAPGPVPDGMEWVVSINPHGAYRGGLCFTAGHPEAARTFDDSTEGWEPGDLVYVNWGHGPAGCVEGMPEFEGF